MHRGGGVKETIQASSQTHRCFELACITDVAAVGSFSMAASDSAFSQTYTHEHNTQNEDIHKYIYLSVYLCFFTHTEVHMCVKIFSDTPNLTVRDEQV